MKRNIIEIILSNKVVVLEENFPFDSTEHARWLYTAVTRASQKLVLIKK